MRRCKALWTAKRSKKGFFKREGGQGKLCGKKSSSCEGSPRISRKSKDVVTKKKRDEGGDQEPSSY